MAGVAIGHASDEIDHAQERVVQGAVRIGCIVAQQVENPSALEGRRSTVVLLQCGTAESVEQNFQGGVGTDFVQGLAFVLKDFLAGNVLGVQHTALGRAMHVLDQIAMQRAGEQCVLLLDKRSRRCVGQMFDGLATQDCELASS